MVLRLPAPGNEQWDSTRVGFVRDGGMNAYVPQPRPVGAERLWATRPLSVLDDLSGPAFRHFGGKIENGSDFSLANNAPVAYTGIQAIPSE